MLLLEHAEALGRGDGGAADRAHHGAEPAVGAAGAGHRFAGGVVVRCRGLYWVERRTLSEAGKYRTRVLVVFWRYRYGFTPPAASIFGLRLSCFGSLFIVIFSG